MKGHLSQSTGLVLAGLLALAWQPTRVSGEESPDTDVGYAQVNLVSNHTNTAKQTDPRLVNPWGLSVGPGLIWVADNGPGLVTLYRPSGKAVTPAIQVPAPGTGGNPGTPTGLVFNDTDQFLITQDGRQAPATFLIATEDGTIAAWRLSRTATSATLMVDNSAGGAVYKGLAIADSAAGAPQIYATNFHAGMVDVFDAQFHAVMAFTDATVPAGFAPFGIRVLGGKLYVTFAKQKLPDLHDDDPGAGNGYVDVFNPDGTLAQRLVSQGALNSPWGLALAPAHFGPLGGDLLVGNFGDGKVTAYDPATGAWVGNLKQTDGTDLVIDGLWGLSFNRDGYGFGRERHEQGEDDDLGHGRLYFTSGPNSEADGLFGFIRRADDPSDDQQSDSD